jgi:Tol biopolymer transport system component
VLAARFDTATQSIAGVTLPVLTGVKAGGNGVAELSLAENGTLLYQAGGAGGVLVAVRRDGVERVLTDDMRNYNDLAVSPDGKWIATGIDGVLWSLDVNRRILNRVTPNSESPASGLAIFPLWSPDGRSIAYAPAPDTYRVISAEGGEPAVLFTMPGLLGGAAWAPDGRSIVLGVGPGDLRAVDLRSGAATDFLVSRFSEQSPSFSPDGSWVAYASNESGRSEVYVRRFQDGRRTRVSVDGGSEPAWSTSGSEIFFRGPAGFMAAAVTPEEDVVVRWIDRLFDDRRYQFSARHREYVVLPGDSAFVFIRGASEGRLFVRFGWAAKLDSLLQGS